MTQVCKSRLLPCFCLCVPCLCLYVCFLDCIFDIKIAVHSLLLSPFINYYFIRTLHKYEFKKRWLKSAVLASSSVQLSYFYFCFNWGKTVVYRYALKCLTPSVPGECTAQTALGWICKESVSQAARSLTKCLPFPALEPARADLWQPHRPQLLSVCPRVPGNGSTYMEKETKTA